MDLSQFLKDLCVKLKETAPNHTLVVEANPSIVVPTDQAIPLGLLANELVTNAFNTPTRMAPVRSALFFMQAPSVFGSRWLIVVWGCLTASTLRSPPRGHSARV